MSERIHQPKLYVFNVGCFKIMCLHRAGDTAPAVSRMQQITVTVYLVVEIIGTSLLWIVGEVEYRQRGGLTIKSISLGKDLLFIYLTHPVIGELIRIIPDVSRSE